MINHERANSPGAVEAPIATPEDMAPLVNTASALWGLMSAQPHFKITLPKFTTLFGNERATIRYMEDPTDPTRYAAVTISHAEEWSLTGEEVSPDTDAEGFGVPLVRFRQTHRLVAGEPGKLKRDIGQIDADGHFISWRARQTREIQTIRPLAPTECLAFAQQLGNLLANYSID